VKLISVELCFTVQMIRLHGNISEGHISLVKKICGIIIGTMIQ